MSGDENLPAKERDALVAFSHRFKKPLVQVCDFAGGLAILQTGVYRIEGGHMTGIGAWYDIEPLGEFPEEIWAFPCLEVLSLKEQRLLVVPSKISTLTRLQKLSIQVNEHLETLPESIGELHSLEELWIGHNDLTKLPDSLKSLVNLRILWFGGNRIMMLPEYLLELPKLHEISIYDNCIDLELPKNARIINALKKMGCIIRFDERYD